MNSVLTESAEQFNPFLPDFIDDPYPHYAAWRVRAPIHRSDGVWYTLDYQLAKQALTDDKIGLEYYNVVPPEYLPATPPQYAPFFNLIKKWMMFRDPPDHTHLRSLLAGAFTKEALAGLQSTIDAASKSLFEKMREGEPVDLITSFAFPLPVIVIGKILGVGDCDIEVLKRWSHALLGGIDLKAADQTDRAHADATQAANELREYLRDEISSCRGSARQDLLTRLASAGVDEEEIIANVALLLFTGHETTVNLIGNGMLALLRNPDQERLLRAKPELLSSAIEEMVRFDSPSQMTFRYALKPCELGGYELQPGEPIGVIIGAANHDPKHFEQPQRFDIQRSPNRHLSFGSGRHVCLGINLARMEAQSAIRTLLSKCESIKLATPHAQWRRSIGMRGLATLPVHLTVS